MAQIKIGNVIYGSTFASDITYKNTTVEKQLDLMPIFDVTDNTNVENNGNDYLTYANILDSLNSSDTDKALSANQGRILNEKFDNIDFSPLEEGIANNTESINLLNTKVDENNTKIENNLSLIFNNWLNDCDVIEKIEEHVAIEGAGGTFMLAFGSNITNAPTEGLEWFIVLYKAARILAWRDDCLFTNARNGASDNYMGWKRYVSEDLMDIHINSVKQDIFNFLAYKNKWKWEKAATCSNTLEAFANQTVLESRFIDDSAINSTLDYAESYTAKCTTYIYVDVDKNISCSLTTDDAGALFVNSTSIGTTVSCTASTFTMPLKAGWNEIIVIYTEGTGKDGWIFNPSFSANTEILIMSAIPYNI